MRKRWDETLTTGALVLKPGETVTVRVIGPIPPLIVPRWMSTPSPFLAAHAELCRVLRGVPKGYA